VTAPAEGNVKHGRYCYRRQYEAKLDPGCMACVREGFAIVRAMNANPHDFARDLMRRPSPGAEPGEFALCPGCGGSGRLAINPAKREEVTA
jgi:hypothetical protein